MGWLVGWFRFGAARMALSVCGIQRAFPYVPVSVYWIGEGALCAVLAVLVVSCVLCLKHLLKLDLSFTRVGYEFPKS